MNSPGNKKTKLIFEILGYAAYNAYLFAFLCFIKLTQMYIFALQRKSKLPVMGDCSKPYHQLKSHLVDCKPATYGL